MAVGDILCESEDRVIQVESNADTRRGRVDDERVYNKDVVMLNADVNVGLPGGKNWGHVYGVGGDSGGRGGARRKEKQEEWILEEEGAQEDVRERSNMRGKEDHVEVQEGEEEEDDDEIVEVQQQEEEEEEEEYNEILQVREEDKEHEERDGGSKEMMTPQGRVHGVDEAILVWSTGKRKQELDWEEETSEVTFQMDSLDPGYDLDADEVLGGGADVSSPARGQESCDPPAEGQKGQDAEPGVSSEKESSDLTKHKSNSSATSVGDDEAPRDLPSRKRQQTLKGAVFERKNQPKATNSNPKQPKTTNSNSDERNQNQNNGTKSKASGDTLQPGVVNQTQTPTESLLLRLIEKQYFSEAEIRWLCLHHRLTLATRRCYLDCIGMDAKSKYNGASLTTIKEIQDFVEDSCPVVHPKKTRKGANART